MNKKTLFLGFYIAATLAFFGGFWYIGKTINYPFHLEIKANEIDHPEFIPSSRSAKISSLGFDNIVADTYWLGTIQYIGGNAYSSEFREYLSVLLSLVTDLNPSFEYPYTLGQLLLSSLDEYHDHVNATDQKKFAQQAEQLGLKGIKNLCDANKIEKIVQAKTPAEAWNNASVKNPCKSFYLPYYLAYNYYWGLKDPQNAAKYYRIAASHTDAPLGAKIMSVIMTGKSGERQTSALMFLNLAETTAKQNSALCGEFSQKLQQVILNGSSQGLLFTNGNFLAQVDTLRQKITEDLGEKDVDASAANVDDFCSVNLNKAVREINLGYLDNASQNCKTANLHDGMRTKELLKNGCIDYKPIDFQKLKNEKDTLYIDYFYNASIKKWDYKMFNQYED